MDSDPPINPGLNLFQVNQMQEGNYKAKGFMGSTGGIVGTIQPKTCTHVGQ